MMAISIKSACSYINKISKNTNLHGELITKVVLFSKDKKELDDIKQKINGELGRMEKHALGNAIIQNSDDGYILSYNISNDAIFSRYDEKEKKYYLIDDENSFVIEVQQ